MIKLSDIQTITEHCIRLLSLTEKLQRDELTKDAHKYAEQLFPSLRKLFIASMMHNKRLICISGLQGAGKTTLMKNFYGIDDDFMNISLGRGERVPVLITECNVSEPHINAISINKDENGTYKKTEIILRKDEIVRATKGEDPTIMYIELSVPYKHTHNDGVSFMLLPGFEKNNAYWNDLIEFSVKSSDAAVFVFNETSFSNALNNDYLNRIEKKFDDNVVYAITGSDGSLDDNEQVKKTCVDVLKVKESDRVVCVGQYSDPEKNSAWISSFKSAIDKYAMFETQVSQKTSNYIYEELLKINDTLGLILNVLNDGDSYEATDYHNHSLLKAFDSAIAAKRKDLSRQISEEFEKAKGCSAKNIANQLDSKSWYKTLKKTFFGANVKEQYIETQEIIKASLKEGDVCLPDKYLGEAISHSIRSIETPSSKSPNALQLLVDIDEKDGKSLLVDSETTKSVISDVCSLIQVPDKNAEHYTIQNPNPKRVLKAVAEVSTYYYGLTSYEHLAEKTTSLAYYEPAIPNLKGSDVLEGAESSKKFALGVAGIMGVDMVTDGSLNLISQIATSCSIALPYAAAAAVMIVGAGAATAVMKDINRMRRTDFESAKMVVTEIYDNIQQEALERFDNFTKQVRDRIEENLEDLSGGNKIILTNYNAKVEVNILMDLISEITEEYLLDTHNVGSFFSR